MKLAVLLLTCLVIVADNQAIIDIENLPPVKPKKEEKKSAPSIPKDPVLKAYAYIA